MASIYIPETEKFLTDASGRFNLGVISMLVAGVSFLAGIEEREKLKKRKNGYIRRSVNIGLSGNLFLIVIEK